MAAWGLHTGKEVDASGARAEHMKVCLKGVTWEKDPYPRRWDKLVSVMKLAFREGRIPMSLTWTMMMIITKGGGEYRGIGLVEVIWKVCAFITNRRLRDATNLHGALHGFRQGRGKAKETTEENMA